MNVSKRVRFGAALLVAAVAATACSDVPSAPAASRQAGDASFGRGYSSGPNNRDYTNDDDSSLPDDPRGKKDPRSGSATFVVDPNESRSYKFGPHSVFIPAHAVCDPATAGYGEELWNSSCDRLREPITITVSWEGKGGHGAVSFQPDLRFAPSSNPARWVVLTLRDKKLISEFRTYSILWENGAKSWVDESVTDPSLRAYVSRTDNTVMRRLKHFSGYLVAASAFSLDDDLGGKGGFSDVY